MLFIDFIIIFWKFQICTEKHLHFTHLNPDPLFLMKQLPYCIRHFLKKIKTEYETAFRIQLTHKLCRTSGHKHRGDMLRPDNGAAKLDCLRHLRHIPLIFGWATHGVCPCDVTDINLRVNDLAHGRERGPVLNQAKTNIQSYFNVPIRTQWKVLERNSYNC